MLPALGVHRLLTQEILALGKLSEKLIVKVVSVGQHNDGRAIQCLLQTVCIEHHRQRFTAALSMPKHTAFAVRFRGVLCGLHSLIDSEILVVAREYLELLQSLVGEADKVLDNVQQSLPLKNTLEEGIELCVLRIFVIAVLRFPLHKAVFAGGNRSSFGGQMVAHDADAVINEHGRNLMHIVPYLCISLRCIRFFSGRRLQLHQNDRQTVEEQKDIGTLVAVLNERPLIGNDEGVVVRIFVVHKVNEAGAFLTLDKITHFNAMLNIVHEDSILLNQFGIFKVFQFEQCIRNGILRHSRVEPPQCGIQFFFI